MKKMNNLGFTLVEVLSVIVLLGIIALIAIPTIQEVARDSRQKLYEEQINLIEEGLKGWAGANVFLLPENNNVVKLTLGQLKQAGFADIKITNPKNNKCFSDETILSITNYNNSYKYNVEKVVDVECKLFESAPFIKLNEDAVEYLYVGDNYIDKGATAKDNNELDITSSITTIITGGESIDTSKEGNYIVTYKVTNNGKTAQVIRNVFVIQKR